MLGMVCVEYFWIGILSITTIRPINCTVQKYSPEKPIQMNYGLTYSVALNFKKLQIAIEVLFI